MSSVVKNLRIGEGIIDIYLLRLSSGKEKEFAKELNELGSDIELFKGFGRYDIVLLNPNFEKEHTFIETLIGMDKENAIIDCDRLVGFECVDETGKEKRMDEKSYPFLGILNIKLNVISHLNNDTSPLELEKETIDKINSMEDDDVTTKCFMGFGWSEILCKLYAKSLDKLLKKVVDVRNNIASGIITTITIPCIRGEYVWFGKKLPNESKKIEKTSLLLLINSFPKAENLVENARHTFGEYDLIVDITGHQNILKIIERIGDIRKTKGITATSTIFSLDYPTQRDIGNSTHSQEDTDWLEYSDYLDVTGVKHKKIKETLKNYVLEAKIKYKFLLSNPLLRDGLDSFIDFPLEFKRYVDNLEGSKNYEAILYRTTEEFLFGMNQRVRTTTPPAIFGQETLLNYTLLTNISSIAAEAIPLYLTNRVSSTKWNSFCIYGYTSTPRLLERGIINLPHYTIFCPQTLWVLFHEVGHIVFKNIDETALEDEAKSLKIEGIILDKKDAISVAEEIYADLFDFHYGFNGKFELYIQTVWRFLWERIIDEEQESKRDDQIINYFYRTFCVYHFLHLKKKKLPLRVREIMSEIADLKEILEKIMSEKLPDLEGKTTEYILKFSNIVELSYQQFKNLEIKNERKGLGISPEKLSDLTEGIPITLSDEGISPVELIRAIITIKEKNLSPQLKAAIYLSLYDYSRRKRYEQRKEEKVKDTYFRVN